MTEVYRGIYKVIEECGELLQVCGKLGPFPHGHHPDGAGDLRERLQQELVDVEAAIVYVQSVNGLTRDHTRFIRKLRLFEEWGLTGLPDGEET